MFYNYICVFTLLPPSFHLRFVLTFLCGLCRGWSGGPMELRTLEGWLESRASLAILKRENWWQVDSLWSLQVPSPEWVTCLHQDSDVWQTVLCGSRIINGRKNYCQWTFAMKFWITCLILIRKTKSQRNKFYRLQRAMERRLSA